MCSSSFAQQLNSEESERLAHELLYCGHYMQFLMKNNHDASTRKAAQEASTLTLVYAVAATNLAYVRTQSPVTYLRFKRDFLEPREGGYTEELLKMPEQKLKYCVELATSSAKRINDKEKVRSAVKELFELSAERE